MAASAYGFTTRVLLSTCEREAYRIGVVSRRAVRPAFGGTLDLPRFGPAPFRWTGPKRGRSTPFLRRPFCPS
jgi:hypothetical protein